MYIIIFVYSLDVQTPKKIVEFKETQFLWFNAPATFYTEFFKKKDKIF